MRAVLAALVLASAVAGCSFGSSQQPVPANGILSEAAEDDAYAEGKRHLLSGNYGTAVRHLRAALRGQQGSPEVLNALAVAYEHLGRRDVAQSYYAQALAADPTSVQTLNNIGRSLMQGGSVRLAGTYLQRAAAADPGDPVVRANLRLIAATGKTGSIEPASARPASRPIWIERTSPAVQTLVTQPSARFEDDPPADESLLPLLSFATLTMPSDDESAAHVSVEPSPREAAAAPADVIRTDLVVLTIANGNGRTGMAARLGAYLAGRSWKRTRVLNADHFGYDKTVIAYKTGFEREARDLAASLPIDVKIEEADAIESHVLLRIGKDLLPFDRHISS